VSGRYLKPCSHVPCGTASFCVDRALSGNSPRQFSRSSVLVKTQ
jgi:hypothetical protein